MTASSIRKQVLHLLAQGLRALDASTEVRPTLVLAQPPLHLPSHVKRRALPIELLQDNKAKGELVQHWEEAHMNATEWAYLLYLAEGEADFRIGVTEKMLAELKLTGQEALSGCWVVSLRAPAFILFPPGVPYSNGARIFWERGGVARGRMTILPIHLMPTEALCHVGVRENENYHASESLIVKDPLLNEAQRILFDELRISAIDASVVACVQLQIILWRLQRDLTENHPVIASTAWASPHLNKSFTGSSRDVALLSELHEYMQIRLRESLTLTQIAQRAKLSVSQVNRIFNKNLGITVMQYVIRLRMESARQILDAHPHFSIKEVMNMVGYDDMSHFSQAFRKAYGISPRKFRDHRRKENMEK